MAEQSNPISINLKKLIRSLSNTCDEQAAPCQVNDDLPSPNAASLAEQQSSFQPKNTAAVASNNATASIIQQGPSLSDLPPCKNLDSEHLLLTADRSGNQKIASQTSTCIAVPRQGKSGYIKMEGDRRAIMSSSSTSSPTASMGSVSSAKNEANVAANASASCKTRRSQQVPNDSTPTNSISSKPSLYRRNSSASTHSLSSMHASPGSSHLRRASVSANAGNIPASAMAPTFTVSSKNNSYNNLQNANVGATDATSSSTTHPTSTKRIPQQPKEVHPDFHDVNQMIFGSNGIPVVKLPSKCPLFCCFYAEFDNKVGPKLLHQCPEGLMEKDINITTASIEAILQATFQQLQPPQESEQTHESSSKQSQSTATATVELNSEAARTTQITTKESNYIKNDCIDNKDIDNIDETATLANVNNDSIANTPYHESIAKICTVTLNDNQQQEANKDRSTPTNESSHKKTYSDGSAVSFPISANNEKRSEVDNNIKTNSNERIRKEHRRVLSGDSNASGRRRNNSKDRDANIVKKSISPILSTNTVPYLTSHQQQRQPSEYSYHAPSTYSASSSIFHSCSEYIITGHELTGNIVNLSTHNIHVLTRPTVIFDAAQYERNSLLFCVRFVLRRSADPRPFRTVLSKLALLLRDMEIESLFLSKSKLVPTTATNIESPYPSTITATGNKAKNTIDTTLPSKPPRSTGQQQQQQKSAQSKNYLQELLNRIFVSLNSVQGECNLILNHNTNVLNLKLFHPPKVPVEPVKDHAVPILLRRDWHLQSYDWDLAINWVSMHIDGILNAKQISQKAQVDMEMVRACLRVLKHHGVIALVDMFFYSNRYECTEKTASIFAGGYSKGNDSKLLQDAVEFVIRGRGMSANTTVVNAGGPCGSTTSAGFEQHQQNQYNVPLSPIINFSTSPILTVNRMFYGSPSNASSCQPLVGSFRMNNLSLSHQPNQHIITYPALEWREDYKEVKSAIVELYCACHRGISFGDLLLYLVSDTNKSNGNKFVHQLEQTRKTINWKKMCLLIDHRRFTTFGIVHGLLKRVHNYPLLVDDTFDDVSLSLGENRFNSTTPNLVGFSPPSSQRLKQSIKNDYNKSTVAGNSHGKESNAVRIEENRKLKNQVATMMDGTHCDDELVCAFEMPLTQLFGLFREGEENASKCDPQQPQTERIISVFSTID